MGETWRLGSYHHRQWTIHLLDKLWAYPEVWTDIPEKCRWRNGKETKLSTCQLMKSAPDCFFCILSIFVDPVCLEENGPPFSMKSRLIDTSHGIVWTRSWNKFDSVPWDHRGPRNPTDHFSSDSEDLSHHPHLLIIPLSGFPNPGATSWVWVTISVGIDNSSPGPYV